MNLMEVIMFSLLGFTALLTLVITISFIASKIRSHTPSPAMIVTRKEQRNPSAYSLRIESRAKTDSYYHGNPVMQSYKRRETPVERAYSSSQQYSYSTANDPHLRQGLTARMVLMNNSINF
ncbi:MAG: hypothetical protein K9J16_18860 [Melioribacteraceae bacterium]|nr:hypothetical protein [Melioribacteraceae bacterium]MCF8355246.1 hypothetical protein [Melioribacteraceae bacterium]MCF8395564.1 hypothetical protein [Melioribacteraceae bacterium]MCF8420864.1 hypothetical protein [Melioribacteraceae bacterium]